MIGHVFQSFSSTECRANSSNKDTGHLSHAATLSLQLVATMILGTEPGAGGRVWGSECGQSGVISMDKTLDNCNS